MQRGFIPLLIILILVAIFGAAAGGYFLYTSLRGVPPKAGDAAISTASNPTSKPESTSSADMTNWKTYTDTNNGFSLKYPPNWSQVNIANNRVAISPELPKPFYPATTFTIPGILIDISNNDASLSSKDYVMQKIIPQNIYTKNGKITLSLSNVDGVIVEGLTNPVSGNPIGPTAYISNKSKVISLELNSTNITDPKNIFNQILSTFKFLN